MMKQEEAGERLYELYPLGEQAVVIRFPGGMEEKTQRLVDLTVHRLLRQTPAYVTEWIRAYTSVTVFYDPWILYRDMLKRGIGEDWSPYDQMSQWLGELLIGIGSEQPDEGARTEGRIVTVPVLFGGEVGPDLAEVAERTGLSETEAVQLYCEPLYRVQMIGFQPGFPYLGGLPGRLFSPRRREPRALVPAGSVGIAGHQTGIYPLPSPGGWQLIGRTPLRLFGPDREPPTLLTAGDRVRFVPLDEAEYAELERQQRKEASDE
ncbi:5-oxoprolinase subunit PxpB [Paenibacillus silviterrae]|uniref:5-oxoprolinase subunit PxpB n=1 Tax=Paenibacillus silviterrae TaxID=3242194 RepID=UPI00254311A0|nr:5-oxoprolinase subunit PxpB [Paenibacillus chinjuensis]